MDTFNWSSSIPIVHLTLEAEGLADTEWSEGVYMTEGTEWNSTPSATTEHPEAGPDCPTPGGRHSVSRSPRRSPPPPHKADSPASPQSRTQAPGPEPCQSRFTSYTTNIVLELMWLGKTCGTYHMAWAWAIHRNIGRDSVMKKNTKHRESIGYNT